jgi:hypothetical protein
MQQLLYERSYYFSTARSPYAHRTSECREHLEARGGVSNAVGMSGAVSGYGEIDVAFLSSLTRTTAPSMVLDDFGPERLNASQQRDLMEIIEDRHGRRSTLITSQLPARATTAPVDSAEA